MIVMQRFTECYSMMGHTVHIMVVSREELTESLESQSQCKAVCQMQKQNRGHIRMLCILQAVECCRVAFLLRKKFGLACISLSLQQYIYTPAWYWQFNLNKPEIDGQVRYDDHCADPHFCYM